MGGYLYCVWGGFSRTLLVCELHGSWLRFPPMLEVVKENVTVCQLSVIGMRVCESYVWCVLYACELGACLHGRKDSDRQAV